MNATKFGNDFAGEVGEERSPDRGTYIVEYTAPGVGDMLHVYNAEALRVVEEES